MNREVYPRLEVARTPLRLNGQQTNSCIDTDAEVTVVMEKVYFCIGSPALKPLDKTLKDAGNNRLDCRGQYLGRLQKGDLTVKEKIYMYVVENVQKSLLGRPAIMGLNLVRRIATERRLEQIRISQDSDPVWQEIARYCQQGWPKKNQPSG